MAVSAITLVSEKELTKVFSPPPAYQLPFLHLSSLTCTTYLFHSSFLSIYMPALFLFLSLSLSLSLILCLHTCILSLSMVSTEMEMYDVRSGEEQMSDLNPDQSC